MRTLKRSKYLIHNPVQKLLEKKLYAAQKYYSIFIRFKPIVFYMMLKKKITLFLFGLNLIFLSVLLLGCQTEEHSDTLSGYYALEPSYLTFFSRVFQINSPEDLLPENLLIEEKKELPLSWIPREMSFYLTNPVAFILQDLAQGKAILTPTNLLSAKDISFVPISIHSNGSLSYHKFFSPVIYWNDPSCNKILEMTAKGSLIQSKYIVSPPQFENPLLGKIHLNIQIITHLHGNCELSLKNLLSCYEDITQCEEQTTEQSEAAQNKAIEILAPLLAAQIITPSKLINLRSYGYEILYE